MGEEKKTGVIYPEVASATDGSAIAPLWRANAAWGTRSAWPGSVCSSPMWMGYVTMGGIGVAGANAVVTVSRTVEEFPMGPFAYRD
jgi:hypothetical protein